MAFSIGIFRDIFNRSLFFILICLLYMLHWCEMEIPIVDSISNYLLLCILGVSLYYAYYAHKHYTLPPFFRAVDLLIAVFVFYGFISIAVNGTYIHCHMGDIKTSTYFVAVMRSFLPVYPFFVYTRKGLLTSRSVSFYSILFLVFCVFLYYRSLGIMLDEFNTDELTNNNGYLFAMLVPAFPLIKGKPIYRYLFLFVVMFYALICVKRGAIICAGIAGVLCLWWSFRYSQSKHRVSIFIISVILVISSVYIFSDYIQSSELFQRRWEITMEGNSSNRDYLYGRCLDYYSSETSFFQKLFGSGADYTLILMDQYAHNDWLEIMVDQGLFGIGIFIFFVFRYFKQWLRLRGETTAYSVVGLCLLLMLLKSFFSMSYSVLPFYVSMFIGYALAISLDDIDEKSCLNHECC